MAPRIQSARRAVADRLRDGRVWTVSTLLVVLYAANWHDLLAPPADLLALPSLGVMFLYLYVTPLGLLFKWIGNMPGFWAGYVAFTVLVTALFTAAVDRVGATVRGDRGPRQG